MKTKTISITDINGSFNILRKEVGNDFISNSIESQQWAKQSPNKITIR